MFISHEPSSENITCFKRSSWEEFQVLVIFSFLFYLFSHFVAIIRQMLTSSVNFLTIESFLFYFLRSSISDSKISFEIFYFWYHILNFQELFLISYTFLSVLGPCSIGFLFSWNILIISFPPSLFFLFSLYYLFSLFLLNSILHFKYYCFMSGDSLYPSYIIKA